MWSTIRPNSHDMANFVRAGRKIVAIGRNFSEHAKELGNAVPKEPFFFLKPTTSYVTNRGMVKIPRGCIVHHESKCTKQTILIRLMFDTNAGDASFS